MPGKKQPVTSTTPRFKAAKRPAKTTKFKPAVRAKRRQAYYTKGRGSVGVLLRHPRVVRVVRIVRAEQNKKYAEMTGIETKGKKQVLFKGFSEVVVGAADAYGNRLMQIAEQFALKRTKKSGAKGMKLRVEDLVSAARVIEWIARQ